MERPLTHTVETLVRHDVPRSFVVPWARIAPIWRHAAWGLMVFLLLAVAVVVRLDVQRLYMDLDRNDRLQNEARVMNERLRLEMDARRRVHALEAAATQLSLQQPSTVVRLEPRP